MIHTIIFLFLFLHDFCKTINQAICNTFHSNDSSSRCNFTTNRSCVCTRWNSNCWPNTSRNSSSYTALTNINIPFKWFNVFLTVSLISEFVSKINWWTHHPIFFVLLPSVTIKSPSKIIIRCNLFLFGHWSNAWSIFNILIAWRYSHFFLQTLWINRFILV